MNLWKVNYSKALQKLFISAVIYLLVLREIVCNTLKIAFNSSDLLLQKNTNE